MPSLRFTRRTRSSTARKGKRLPVPSLRLDMAYVVAHGAYRSSVVCGSGSLYVRLQQLIDYISMDRWGDPAYRAYDLQAHYSPKGVKRALRFLGYSGAEPNMLLWQVWADLNARNVHCAELPQTVYEWFVWQRINDGDLRQWPMRSTK